MPPTSITWDLANFIWNDAPQDKDASRYTWDDVALVEEALKSLGGAGTSPGSGDDFIHPFFDKDPEKKKRLVKLICKVQGKTIKKEKEIKNYKITVKDIQLLTEEVLGINVTIL